MTLPAYSYNIQVKEAKKPKTLRNVYKSHNFMLNAETKTEDET